MENLKLRNLQGKMRNLILNNDFLSRDYARERYYPDPTGIEKAMRSVKDKQRTLQEKEYKKLSSQLGTKVPKTMAEFLDMKYNNTVEY